MKSLFLVLGMLFLAGCRCLSDKNVTNVAVLSFGDLEGRKMKWVPGIPFEMRCGEHSGNPAKLSCAVEKALSGTEYDTLLDAVVTIETTQYWCFWLSSSACTMRVEGKGVCSSDFPKESLK